MIELVAVSAIMLVCGMLAGAAFGRPAAPPRPQTEPVTPLSAVVADHGVQLAAMKRQLTDLEVNVEARHRSLSGQISVGRRKDRAPEPEQLELPPGPERDALIDQVAAGQARGGVSTAGEPDGAPDPTQWPMELVVGRQNNSRRRRS